MRSGAESLNKLAIFPPSSNLAASRHKSSSACPLCLLSPFPGATVQLWERLGSSRFSAIQKSVDAFGRGMEGPRAGSRQRQHSTAVRITVTIYSTMTKLNRTVKERHQAAGKTVKQEKQNQTNTRERHKGKTAVLLQSVQTESKLPLCVSNLTTGDTEGLPRQCPLCRRPQLPPSMPSTEAIDATIRRHQSHQATIDAIEATTIDSIDAIIDATKAIESSHFPFAHSPISVEGVTGATLHPRTFGAITVHEHLIDHVTGGPPIRLVLHEFCESTHPLVRHQF